MTMAYIGDFSYLFKKIGHRGIGFAPIVCLIDKDPTKQVENEL